MYYIIAPVYIGGMRKYMGWDVVDLDLPLLLSLPVLKKLDLVVQYRQQESTDLGYFNGVKFRIDNHKGHQWIRLSQTGSKTIFEVTLLGLDF